MPRRRLSFQRLGSEVTRRKQACLAFDVEVSVEWIGRGKPSVPLAGTFVDASNHPVWACIERVDTGANCIGCAFAIRLPESFCRGECFVERLAQRLLRCVQVFGPFSPRARLRLQPLKKLRPRRRRFTADGKPRGEV